MRSWGFEVPLPGEPALSGAERSRGWGGLDLMAQRPIGAAHRNITFSTNKIISCNIENLHEFLTRELETSTQ